MRNALFRLAARRFPTERIDRSRVLAGLWRILFYAIGPTEPFVLRTRRYRVWAHPTKGTLTRALIRRGHWEPDVTAALLGCVPAGGFAIDAGANFGHYALTFASLAGAGGLVVAFEPDAASFALLQANAALQAGAAIRCVRAGLGARRGTLTLVHDDANPGGHSFVPGNVRAAGAANAVEVYALDAWLAEAGLASRRLDLIKIDVQGFEGRLIAGARQTIERHRPAVMCEVTPAAMRAAGDAHRDLIEWFVARNYALRPVVNGAALEMEAAALFGILEDGRDHVDVLLVAR